MRPKRAFGQPRQVFIQIPSRYVLRSSKANRIIWLLLTPVAIFLLAVCLFTASGWARELLPFAKVYGGPMWLVWLGGIMLWLGFGALTLVCPLLAVKSRKDSLTVDGEQLLLQRWRRKPVAFCFTDIAFVRARKGRENLLIQGREGRVLCRLSVTMEHMDILQADLRSRRVPFAERDGPIMNAFILTPGPRQDEITLHLPGAVPGYYWLSNPPVFMAIFILLLAFSLGTALLLGLTQKDPAVLGFLPFSVLAVVGLVWVKRERIEVFGNIIRRRNPLGRWTEFHFSDVAAVRVSTLATGIGPLSSFELMGRDGKAFLNPPTWMSGAEFLLADLLNRGIPFTY